MKIVERFGRVFLHFPGFAVGVQASQITDYSLHVDPQHLTTWNSVPHVFIYLRGGRQLKLTGQNALAFAAHMEGEGDDG